MTNPLFCCIISERNKHGSLVKRLRHGPLKAETGVRFSHESPAQEAGQMSCFFISCAGDSWSNELTATSQRRSGAEFAYPTRRSKSSLFRRRVRVYSPRAKLFPRYARPNSDGVFLSFGASSCIKTSTRHGANRLTLDEKHGIINSTIKKNL